MNEIMNISVERFIVASMRTKCSGMQIIKITLLFHCFFNELTMKRSNYLNFNVFLLFFQCFFNKKQ